MHTDISTQSRGTAPSRSTRRANGQPSTRDRDAVPIAESDLTPDSAGETLRAVFDEPGSALGRVDDLLFSAFESMWDTATTTITGIVLTGDHWRFEPQIDSEEPLYDQIWGQNAPDHWDAVVACTGGAVSAADDPTLAGTGSVTLWVMIQRSGVITSRIVPKDSAIAPITCSLEPEGALVDALLRFFGCPTASEPRETTHLVNALWADRLLGAALDKPELVSTFELAARFHPLIDPNAELPATVRLPSVLASMTRRLSQDTSWERLRQLCAQGSSQFGGVTASDAKWADDSMFARLLLDQYPTILEILESLTLVLPPAVCRSIRRTVVLSMDNSIPLG